MKGKYGIQQLKLEGKLSSIRWISQVLKFYITGYFLVYYKNFT